MNFKHILIILFTFSVKFSCSKVISNRGLFCPPKPETKPDFEAAKVRNVFQSKSRKCNQEINVQLIN